MSTGSSRHATLVVNADDFGRTAEINDGIELAFRTGIVSSTSIVASSPAFDHAVTIGLRNPELDVGIHLTLNEYPALGNDAFLSELSAMSMPAAFARLARARLSEIALIEAEFGRQIDKVMSAGIPISHLDGHNHVHIHPRVVAIACKVASKFGIGIMRLPMESFAVGSGQLLEKAMLNGACGFGMAVMAGRGIRWPGAFHGFSEGGRLTKDRLMAILSRMRSGGHELMCHVGTNNDDPPFSIGYSWATELTALTAFSKSELWDRYGIRIVRRNNS